MKVHVTFNNEYVAKAVLAACRRRQRELKKQLDRKPFTPKPGRIDITAESVNSLNHAIEELSNVVS